MPFPYRTSHSGIVPDPALYPKEAETTKPKSARAHISSIRPIFISPYLMQAEIGDNYKISERLKHFADCDLLIGTTVTQIISYRADDGASLRHCV